jgi:hypothetical protein
MMGGGMPPMAWGPPKFKNMKIDYNKKEAIDKNKCKNINYYEM